MVKEVMHRSISSIEQAEKILENGFIELEDAIEYLKVNDANNAVLAKFKGEDIENLKKQRAVDIYTGAVKVDTGRGSFNRDTQAADRFVKDMIMNGEDVRQYMKTPATEEITIEDVEEKAVENENNVDIKPENSEAVERNIAWLDSAFKEHFEATDEDGVPAWRRHNADVLDRIKFTDNKGKENDKIRKKSEATIWEIAKSEVLRERSFDFGFMALKKEDKLKLLRADLSDSVAKTSLGVIGISPVINIKVGDEVAVEELAKVDAKTAVEAVDKFLSDTNKEKAVVKEAATVGAALHESEKMERFISYVEKKQYSPKVVESLKGKLNKFSETMKSFWGKAWTGAKEYVANNRTRLLVDTAATLAVVLTPPSYAIVGAYAAYTTLGSFVWPIVEKRRRAIRQAKREGRNYDDYKLGLKFNGLRKAWRDIKSNEKEYRRYKNDAKLGAAAGIIVAGGLGVLGTGLVKGVSATTARIGGVIARSLSSFTSQTLNFRNTKRDLKLEDNEENREAYKSAKWGLIIGGTIAALTVAWSTYNILSSQPEVEAPKGNAKGAADQAQEAAQKAAKKSAKVVKDAAENIQPEAEVSAIAYDYPPVWSEESGLSQKHFGEIYGTYDADGNWHHGKINGVFAQRNAAFDQWNADHPDALRPLVVREPMEAYAEMKQNLHNFRVANPDAFPGKTDDQIIYQYIKLVEQTERTVPGPVVDGVETRISRVGKDGQFMYWTNAEEMRAMNAILDCGTKAEVEVSTEALNASLDRIDMSTGKGIGKEFAKGVTQNEFIGYGPKCKEGVSMWRAVKQFFHKEPEAPAAEATVDANVRSVQVKEIDMDEGGAQAVYTQETATMGRGTATIHEGDLTDKTAQAGKKVGSSIPLDNTSRKLDVNWVHPSKEGGR